MLYVLIEPLFSDSPWGRIIFDGLKNELVRRKQKYLTDIGTDGNISERGFAFLIGNNGNWLEENIIKCEKNSIHPIILSSLSEAKFYGRCSTVSSNIRQSMIKVLDYLKMHGKESTALFGVNVFSLTNMMQLENYRCYTGKDFSDDSVYYNNGSVDECSNRLISDIAKFDSVIGVNDFATIHLLKKLADAGKNLTVVSYGNSELAKKYYPDLFSVSMGYENYGKAAFDIYETLKNNAETDYIMTTVKCRLDDKFLSESDNGCSQVKRYVPSAETKDLCFYSDDEIMDMLNIENMLHYCDNIDYEIINLLLNGLSYEEIAEKLFCAVNTVKYRVKKMKSNCLCESKSKMMRILKNYCGI